MLIAALATQPGPPLLLVHWRLPQLSKSLTISTLPVSGLPEVMLDRGQVVLPEKIQLLKHSQTAKQEWASLRSLTCGFSWLTPRETGSS